MDDYDSKVQDKLDELMPWVGLYIAAASAVCTLAMVADTFNGFRQKKIWFPCRYFTLNAIYLTLLAVAVKLTQDVSTNLISNVGTWLPKINSLVFMSTAMANFMSSLGSMTDKELLANVAALGILSITIEANVLIQYIKLERFFIPIMLPTASMLFLLPILVASSVSVPTIKRDLELKYQEKHKAALRGEVMIQRRRAFRIDDQREEMMKYWVMAETSSPQFVMARSVVYTTSTLIPLIPVIILAKFYFEIFVDTKEVLLGSASSAYGPSIKWILVIQAIGVFVGLIAPIFRWFLALGFKCSSTKRYSFRNEFKIETHWIQTLLDWRDSFSALQIGQDKCMKYLHDVKWFILTFCIGVQIFIVMFSKLLVLILSLLICLVFLCFAHTKEFIMHHLSKVLTSNNHVGNDQSGDDTYLNLSRYVLLLEGEAELPRWILKNICLRADNVMQRGRKKQPQGLISLLRKFDNFKGVGRYDIEQIPSLHSQEPPSCWTLPVVTLTSIAISLPHIGKDKRKQLLRSVNEGLSLAKIVEKTFNTNAEFLNIRNATDVSWIGVSLYMKWLGMNLTKLSLKCKNSEEVLQVLSNKAEKTIIEFKNTMTDPLMENPINWRVNILAANSMYRISRTVLMSCEAENEQTNEELFEQLSVMIADIFAACFTNLTHAITTMCHRNAIEKREKSVHEAFLLLGKTEKILEYLQEHEWPDLDHDKASHIDEWRAFFWRYEDVPLGLTPSSSNDIVASPMWSEEDLAITVDS